jgi:hypothetical protein
MFRNYRRNFFIALMVIVFLLVTDTSVEQSARQMFLSTFGLDIGGNVGLFGTLDSFRLTALQLFNNLYASVTLSLQASTGFMYMLWYALRLGLSLLQVVAANFYLFYLAVAVLVYFILTSRLFKNSYDY